MPVSWSKKTKPPPKKTEILQSVPLQNDNETALKSITKIPAVRRASGMEEKMEGLRKQFERMALEFIRRLEKRKVSLGIRSVSKNWDDVKEYLW